jgi:disulfide bond formation protein DsbB
VSVESFQTFFAVLALLVLAGAVALLVLSLLRRRSALAASIVEPFAAAALPLAWLVALVSTIGSLYFSEVADYLPCTLCWYQRIAMYPMALILGIATFRRDRSVHWYAIPLASVGAAISVYHWLIERYPSLEAGGTCSAIVPCTVPWFTEFGFVTLAFMAFSGFTFIIVSLSLRPQEA